MDLPGLFIISENFGKNLRTLKTKPANISLLHEKGEKGNHFDAIIIKPMIESVIAGFGFSQGPNIIKINLFQKSYLLDQFALSLLLSQSLM